MEPEQRVNIAQAILKDYLEGLSSEEKIGILRILHAAIGYYPETVGRAWPWRGAT